MKFLSNCFQNLNEQGKELYLLAPSNKEKHVTGEKHLLDLTDSIKFMAKQFDDYEKDRAEMKS